MQRQFPRGLIIVVIAVALLVGVQVAMRVLERPNVPPQVAADVFYFYSSKCEDCAKVRPLMLKLEKARADLRIEKIDIRATTQAGRMLSRYGKQYGLTLEEMGEVPAMFIEDERKAYVGLDDVIKAISRLIKQAPRAPGKPVTSKR
jgi:thiol-disulfide isomerase/thioredoxin